MRTILLLCLLLCLPAWADTLISNELNTPLYDCRLTLTPAEARPLVLDLEGGVRVTFTLKAVTVARGRDLTGTVAMALRVGQPATFTLARREGWLGVLQDDRLLWGGPVARGPGAEAHWVATRGWRAEARVQRLEPVAFADNFMRTADEPGAWHVQRGVWALQSAWDRDPKGGAKRFQHQSYAQNPFAWVGSAEGGSALCTAGTPAWEDYTLTAAVQGPRDGAVGVVVNMPAPDTGLLVRWTPVTDHGPRGNRLTLVALRGGAETVLAESAGGYLPGQWYRLAVTTSPDGVRVRVDDHPRLEVRNAAPRRGGIGLYAEGAGATFDDITAYGRTLQADLIAEGRVAQIAARIASDQKGMAVWAAPADDWHPVDGLRVHHFDFYGDHWISLTAVVGEARDGALTLLLNGDGAHADRGFRAVLTRTGAQLFRDTQLLATVAHPLAPDRYAVRLRRTGTTLSLSVDGETLLTADAPPLTGRRPAFAATGCFTAVDACALGRQLLDYSFADAPTDWLAEGTWMPTTRWSCSNQWSFLGGWSRGDAALWHKTRLAGDQFIQTWMGVKMEYPREHMTYHERYRDLAVTLCGDGRDPRSGYAGIINVGDADGHPTVRSVLLRRGVEVAASTERLTTAKDGHTHWYALELRKHGAVVEFRADDHVLATFTDPEPLAEGIPAVWTHDNGITVARVRLGSAVPFAPRTDAQIALDAPWYPAWADVGRPLTLDFSGTASTADAPTRLAVTPRQAPPDAAAPTVDGMRLVFTPSKPGTYWYQVNAVGGAVHSPAFHLALPAFTPALGRNDADAVVLYRFDEGTGTTVRDHGTGAPANLTIPPGAAVAWVPGQGLAVHGAGHVMSAAVPKLMTLAQRKAATVELWVATDSLYPPTTWLGGLLAWEKPGEARNLTLAQSYYDLAVGVAGTTFNPKSGGAARFKALRTGLQHLVVTWDGTVTCAYVNGVKFGTDLLDWHPERWAADAPLLVGTLADGQPNYTLTLAKHYGPAPYILPQQTEMQHCYLGTFYLAAIHRRCLSPDEVARHYAAGPSAR
jgi:hypothetical protein